MDPVITATGLRKRYGDVVAVDRVDLDVRAGEILGVLGPNGAGKTTTVECIAGIRRPDEGTVRVLGLDPATDARAVRQAVGIQLQQAVLPARMQVREAMAVFAAGHDDPADPDELLADVGLEGKRRAAFASLSGGQRQRLFIALAQLGRPRIVILDELTTGLDPAARRDAWQMVRDLRERGVTVVLVTHDLDEAAKLCDRIVVIAAGRIAFAGTPTSLQGDHDDLESAYLAVVDRAATAEAAR